MSGNSERRHSLVACGFCEATPNTWFFENPQFACFAIMVEDEKDGLHCRDVGHVIPRNRSRWKCFHCTREANVTENVILNGVYYNWRDTNER